MKKIAEDTTSPPEILCARQNEMTRREDFAHLWSLRNEVDEQAWIEVLRNAIEDVTREILTRLYPATQMGAVQRATAAETFP